VCRALEQEGVLHRYIGADGKIVNELVENAEVPPSTRLPVAPAVELVSSAELAVARAADHARPAGSSAEQRDAERMMLVLLGNK